jgi:hypothetical protein
MASRPLAGPAHLHGSELIRRRLAEWYVETGREPPAALAKVADIAFELMRQGPVSVWRHAGDGCLRCRLVSAGSRDPNEERVATFRSAKKRRPAS